MICMAFLPERSTGRGAWSPLADPGATGDNRGLPFRTELPPVLERILLTNDDGIDAPGMAVMEQIAGELAREVWVVAPEHDQSGQSHAISLHHALRVTERGPRRFGVTGTPGDCAVMGICHLMKEAPPELVLSGVNRGLNLGMETVFSGTVGGAMTAMMLGVPAIALSQAFTDRANVPWDTARTLGAGPAQTFLRVFLPLSFPGIVSGTVLTFIVSLGLFVTPVLLGGPQDRTFSMLIEQEVNTFGNFSRAAELSVFLLVVSGLL
ncbi:MAG: 5'/3'-nucleotidase SurE, partial [Rhodospirillales bacterium]|nr:5'/3'-nucleotidase SurE [Rhodospirillales bacterium]